MNKAVAILVILSIIFTFTFTVTSCSASDTEEKTYAAVGEMLQREANAPAGTVYTSSAQEDESGYIQPALEEALWGGADEMQYVKEYSHFLSSFEHPCELAVFLCYTKSGAHKVSQMCLRRISELSFTWKNVGNEDYMKYIRNAKVAVKGKYVIMAISSDAETAIKAAKSII